jgi:hypothetical protein
MQGVRQVFSRRRRALRGNFFSQPIKSTYFGIRAHPTASIDKLSHRAFVTPLTAQLAVVQSSTQVIDGPCVE